MNKSALSLVFYALQRMIKLKLPLSVVLSSTSHNSPNRSEVMALSYGTCRYYYFIKAVVLPRLLTRPLKKKDKDVTLLLITACYAVIFLNIPNPYVASEAVKIAKRLKQPWASGLINACLRKLIREPALINDLSIQAQSDSLHPQWLEKKIGHAWPKQYEAIIRHNNEHPPMTLRVNESRISPENYLKKLLAVNITAHLDGYVTSAIHLESPISVSQLPGFEDGYVSVQDISAQLAAHFLDASDDDRVLDACAAPGGKTAHILEKTNSLISMTALDISHARIQKLKSGLARLSLGAHCIEADALSVHSWWDGTLFDKILLDAPCSAVGVIRRNPDIKLTRTSDDVTNIVKYQAQLLSVMWPLLKPGGSLLYATCSIFPEENDDQIQMFLSEHADAKAVKLLTTHEQEQLITPFGLQCFPGMGDGFYYAKLLKKM